MVWQDGENQLLVHASKLSVTTRQGLVAVAIPVACDQTGNARVTIHFAVGDERQPAGLFAATERLPRGPIEIVDVWGEALIAFAWQALIGSVTDLANETGHDQNGDKLIPLSIAALRYGFSIEPMARHSVEAAAQATRVRAGVADV